MSKLEIKARELANYLLVYGDPIKCTDRYNYFGCNKRSDKDRPVRKNCYGMTFKINMNEYPNVREVQLTSLVRFFRTDLEVYIKLDNGEEKFLEVLNFGEHFINRWNEVVSKRKAKEAKEDEDKWLSSIDNILKK